MKFESTGAAIEFGKSASKAQIEQLKKQHVIGSKVFDTLYNSGRINYDFLMRIATDCQFIREAIEASQYN